MNLSVSLRTDKGKGPSRQYRINGKIPGVIYGSNHTPTKVLIDLLDLNKYIKAHGTSRMLSLAIDSKEKVVLFKEIARDKLTGNPLHVDFFEVDQNKDVKRDVTLNFIGTPVGVTTQAGVLLVLTREITISCLPKNIPEKAIDVNIEPIGLNENLHASDIILPQNVQLVSPGDMPIVSVSMPKEEKAPEPEEVSAEGAEVVESAQPSTEEQQKEPELVSQKGKKDKDEE